MRASLRALTTLRGLAAVPPAPCAGAAQHRSHSVQSSAQAPGHASGAARANARSPWAVAAAAAVAGGIGWQLYGGSEAAQCRAADTKFKEFDREEVAKHRSKETGEGVLAEAAAAPPSPRASKYRCPDPRSARLRALHAVPHSAGRTTRAPMSPRLLRCPAPASPGRHMPSWPFSCRQASGSPTRTACTTSPSSWSNTRAAPRASCWRPGAPSTPSGPCTSSTTTTRCGRLAPLRLCRTRGWVAPRATNPGTCAFQWRCSQQSS